MEEDDDISFEGSLIKANQTEDEANRNYSESQRPRHKKNESLSEMIDLLTGVASTIDVDGIDIEDQKAKAEQVIGEFKAKIALLPLESPRLEDPLCSSGTELNSTARRDVVEEFDFCVGEREGLMTSLVCIEKLRILRIPNELVPKGGREGKIITISLIHKEAEKEARIRTILDIQEEVMKYSKSCDEKKSRFSL
eukprot:TRINITY_DN2018_c0_g1_i2.p1 TRINITY_DN2018_c0_g1~~TRINITY_DN2018_c0_g1_i2.p1  ORF type:complete len:195 (-),score=72.66 TRINITY_DN2018_c0_g1_i2:187-771(-)